MTEVWSRRANAYRDAVEQREGADLDRIVEWCLAAEARTAIDVATGGGHVARRLREAGLEVVSADPAPGMHADVFCYAENLPFAARSFDGVVTRIAPHHFSDVAAAVGELARVARKVVIVEDTLYASDTVEEAERLRDPTHVRSCTEEEWRGLLEGAGLELEAVERHEKRRPFEAWLTRTGTSESDGARVRELLAERIVDGDYVDTKVLMRARRP
ncbi:MAG: class I SAM-dependent methyltransferase [Gaiellaceae bacterium]